MKYYAFDRQNERPLISIDREVFMKTVHEWFELSRMKKELGKAKRQKFETIFKGAF